MNAFLDALRETLLDREFLIQIAAIALVPLGLFLFYAGVHWARMRFRTFGSPFAPRRRRRRAISSEVRTSEAVVSVFWSWAIAVPIVLWLYRNTSIHSTRHHIGIFVAVVLLLASPFLMRFMLVRTLRLNRKYILEHRLWRKQVIFWRDVTQSHLREGERAYIMRGKSIIRLSFLDREAAVLRYARCCLKHVPHIRTL